MRDLFCLNCCSTFDEDRAYFGQSNYVCPVCKLEGKVLTITREDRVECKECSSEYPEKYLEEDEIGNEICPACGGINKYIRI